MQYRLVVTYWTITDDLCGCDTVFLEKKISPIEINYLGFYVPSVAHKAIVSLENVENASLLWLAGYEIVGTHGFQN